VRIIDPTNGSRSHLAGEKSLSDSASVSIAAALNARESLIRVPKTLSAFHLMCVGNKDRSPMRVYSCDTAPGPTGLAEIVCDDFPVLHEHTAFLFKRCLNPQED
jgi:hypothetical protein